MQARSLAIGFCMVSAVLGLLGCRREAAILEAARWGDVETVAELLHEGVSLDVRDEWGNTPIHLAARRAHGGAPVVNLLLTNGASVSCRNGSGWTPLHVAVDPAVAKLLITHGADVNARDRNGQTPLHAAVTTHDSVTIRRPSEDGTGQARPERVVPEWYVGQHVALVDCLIGAGAQLDATDTGDQTPLHVAAREGDMTGAKALVAAGASLRAKDYLGNTPAQAAVLSGHTDLASFLRQQANAPQGSK